MEEENHCSDCKNNGIIYPLFCYSSYVINTKTNDKEYPTCSFVRGELSFCKSFEKKLKVIKWLE